MDDKKLTTKPNPNDAFIYGIGSGPLNEVFYVGSTIKSLQHRFYQHMGAVRASKHENRNFTVKVQEVGIDSCWIRLLARTEATKRFQCEYEWIGRFNSENVQLTNIIKTESAGRYIAESKARNRKETLLRTVSLWVDNFPRCQALRQKVEANPDRYPEVTGIRRELLEPSLWEKFFYQWFVLYAKVTQKQYGQEAFDESVAYIKQAGLGYMLAEPQEV